MSSALDLRSQSTAISNGIASMHREHYGRGADRVRTTIHPDHALTVLEDCFTPVERYLIVSLPHSALISSIALMSAMYLS